MAAGDAVYVGATGFTLVAKRLAWRVGQGLVTIRTYEGKPSEADAFYLTLLAETTIQEVTRDEGDPYRFYAVFQESSSDADELLEAENEAEWTLEPYELPKSLGTHGKFNEAGGSEAAIAEIDAAIAAGTVGDTDWDVKFAGVGEMNAYAKLRSMGVTEWLTFGFRLRQTLTLNRESGAVNTLLAASDLQGQILEWDDIKVPAKSGITRPWVHIYIGGEQNQPLATDPIVKAATDPLGWYDIWINEWLKYPPRLGFTKVGRTKKRRVDFEWVGAVQWSETLYEGGTGTP